MHPEVIPHILQGLCCILVYIMIGLHEAHFEQVYSIKRYYLMGSTRLGLVAFVFVAK